MSRYSKEVKVFLTEKQYRYLEVLCLLKKKKMSAVIRDIVEMYRNSHRI